MQFIWNIMNTLWQIYTQYDKLCYTLAVSEVCFYNCYIVGFVF